MEINQEPEALQAAPPEPPSPFDLGALIGRGQAFGLIANRAVAAQVETLKQIHDSRSFETLGLSWDDFCERHAGISGSHAYRLLQRLDEFGVSYFKLAQIARISPELYRAIAPAVSDDGIEIDGEVVAIVPENGLRIRQAVRRLQEQLAIARKPVTPPSIVELMSRLDVCLQEMSVMSAFPPSRELHPSLRGLVVYCQNKLKTIADRIPTF